MVSLLGLSDELEQALSRLSVQSWREVFVLHAVIFVGLLIQECTSRIEHFQQLGVLSMYCPRTALPTGPLM